MSIPRKTRPEAVLKNLAKARKDAIIEYMEVARIEEIVKRTDKMGVTTETTRLRTPTFLETADWLAKDGIITSTSALSAWRSSYLLQLQMKANEAAALELVQEGKAQGWLETAEQEQAAAQIFFNRLAMSNQDPKQWAMVQKVEAAREQRKLDREKLELELQKYKDDRAKSKTVLEDKTLSPEEKQLRMREILGMS